MSNLKSQVITNDFYQELLKYTLVNPQNSKWDLINNFLKSYSILKIKKISIEIKNIENITLFGLLDIIDTLDNSIKLPLFGSYINFMLKNLAKEEKQKFEWIREDNNSNIYVSWKNKNNKTELVSSSDTDTFCELTKTMLKACDYYFNDYQKTLVKRRIT